MKIRSSKKKKWIAVLLVALLIFGAVSFRPVSMYTIGVAEGGEGGDDNNSGGNENPTVKPDTPKPTDAPTPKPADTPTPKPADTPTPAPTDTPVPTDTPAPTNPDNSDAPGGNTDPTDPENPDNTGAPGGDTDPENPDNTGTPGGNTDPTDPPTNPDNTGTPGGNTDPTDEPDPNATPEPMATQDPNLEDQSPDPVKSTDKVELKPKSKYSTWYGVVPTDEQGMPIPILYQTDYPTIICTIRGVPRSVASSGCGATSVSMIIAYLTGNTEQNPYSLFYEAVEAGRYNGMGLDHETLSWLCRRYGVHTEWIRNDADAIVKALNEGKPVVAHMGPGIFTRGGHYVVLRGVAKDGKILMNDPVSPTKTHRKFPIQTLLTQAKNRTSFMVCWTDPQPEEEDAFDLEGEMQNEAGRKSGTSSAAEDPNPMPKNIFDGADDGITPKTKLAMALSALFA